MPELLCHGIWMHTGNPESPIRHADAFGTFLALHLQPELVRRDQIVDPKNEPVKWEDPNLDFS